jgi:hypothetical protein
MGLDEECWIVSLVSRVGTQFSTVPNHTPHEKSCAPAQTLVIGHSSCCPAFGHSCKQKVSSNQPRPRSRSLQHSNEHQHSSVFAPAPVPRPGLYLRSSSGCLDPPRLQMLVHGAETSLSNALLAAYGASVRCLFGIQPFHRPL